MVRTLVGLAHACHPGPSVAVTAFATALAVRADLSAARVVLVAAAVLAGQLSIGWLNDYLDRDLDRQAARADKPVAAGQVVVDLLPRAVVAAGIACVALSFALGWRPGVLHVVAVGSAWSYDLWLKPTLLSPVPFALSFGLLPAVVTTATPSHPFPSGWIVAAGALLGVAAHLANTVGDVWADQVTHVRGLPQVIGPTASSVGAAVLVALASVCVLAATRHSPVTRLLAVAAAVVAAASCLGGRRTAFPGTVLAAGVAVAAVVAAGPLPT